MDSGKHYLTKKLSLEENNLCVQFVTTGQRPQNFIKNTEPLNRFVEYPKLTALIQQKTALIKQKNHPPVYIKEDLKKFDLSKLGKFDVILIDPPWEEYEKRAKGLPSYLLKPERYKSWSLEELLKLNVQQIADNPSFVFLWVGSDHLDDGRELFKKWGYKRCEDIIWIKTNKKKDGMQAPPPNERSILQRVKQHCLVGLKGDIKKASDSSFIHSNIDIDVIVDEEPEAGSLRKPTQIYDTIERFCLGRKRLELFGENHNIRDGWLTIGRLINQTKFIEEEYNSWFNNTDPNSKAFKGGRLIGTNSIIESLRPKEAVKEPKHEENQNNQNNNNDKGLSASKPQTG